LLSLTRADSMMHNALGFRATSRSLAFQEHVRRSFPHRGESYEMCSNSESAFRSQLCMPQTHIQQDG